jgi:quinol monooxygenase YgiN
MSTQSNTVSIHPYFKVQPGKLSEVKAMLPTFVAKAAAEPGTLCYDFTFNGEEMFCREAYSDAEAALAHVGNVGPALGELLKLATLARLEVHGPAAELEKLKGPMGALKPVWFVYETGVQR